MKKTLTENISRYDDKMRLRLDRKTIRAAIISGVPSVLIGWVFGVDSLMSGIQNGLLCFLALMLFQLGKVDGIPLSKYARAILRQYKMTRVKYQYTSADRIAIRDSKTEEKNDGINGIAKKQKQKKNRS